MRLRFSISLVALVSVAGCSLGARTDRTVAQALPVHVAGLESAPSTDAYFVVPPGAAWNAAMAVIDSEFGIESADPSQAAAVVAWQYATELTGDGLEAVQSATQASIRMIPQGPGHFAFEVESEAMERRRGVCEEPSEWEPKVPSHAASRAVADRGEAAIAALRHAPWEQVRFAGEPAAVLGAFAQRLAPYDAAEVQGNRLLTGWRVSEHVGRKVAVQIRSRIEAIARAAEPGFTLLSVRAQLQYTGADEDGETGWTDGDASRVAEHAWAAASRYLSPTQYELPDEPPRPFGGDERTPPDLEAPVDPGVGDYQIYAAFQVPPQKPDGRPWDLDPFIGEAVRNAPMLARIGVALSSGGASSAFEVARLVFEQVNEQRRPTSMMRRFENMVADYMATAIEARSAPDPTVLLSVQQIGADGQARWVPAYRYPVVRDATAAAWAPVPVSLHGQPLPVLWLAEDRDMRNDDPIAQGVVDLLDVVRSCEHTTSGDLNVGQLRLIAERAR